MATIEKLICIVLSYYKAPPLSRYKCKEATVLAGDIPHRSPRTVVNYKWLSLHRALYWLSIYHYVNISTSYYSGIAHYWPVLGMYMMQYYWITLICKSMFSLIFSQ